ncbi:MAG: KEOPS complex N(6)-L-threonylcarbamoyladenine synthase Kae1 [Candidatus Aenigmatarchaeota archaeon]
MLCLGIESTAHTFGAGVFDGKKILSEIKDVYRPAKGWGIVPLEAAAHHRAVADKVVRDALLQAGVDMTDVQLIAFSRGPGLPPCLRAGYEFLKRIKKPKIGVNHCVAHIEIGRFLTGLKDPVSVYVSGANTQIVSWVDGRYRIFGETQDMGIGNALDKFGRAVGLTFPAGPEIETMAKEGKWIDLPYTVKGMDLSFSGIVTEAIRKFRAGISLNDLCFSLQETCFAMITEVAERALAHLGKSELLLTGGVSANERLAQMLETMAKERGCRFARVPKRYAGDNGAMIAVTGFITHTSGLKIATNPRPNERTDDVEWPEKVFKYQK